MPKICYVLAKQSQGEVLTCKPSDDVAAVLKMMLEHHRMSIPVFENGRLLGVVSYGDLVVARAEGASGVYGDGFPMGAMGK